METVYKFGFLNPEEQPYCFPVAWAIEQTTGPKRLLATPADRQIDLLVRLIGRMSTPFWMLYVLLVSRGPEESGRYESPNIESGDKVIEFLQDFKEFFQNDGRHCLWIASGADLLIYDQHNRIYAYGNLDAFTEVLIEFGLSQMESIRLPVPHVHHYHAGYDEQLARLLERYDWHRKPLQESDDE